MQAAAQLTANPAWLGTPVPAAMEMELCNNQSTHLLLLHRLEDLDDTLLVVAHVHALKHLAVLAAPNLQGRVEQRKRSAFGCNANERLPRPHSGGGPSALPSVLRCCQVKLLHAAAAQLRDHAVPCCATPPNKCHAVPHLADHLIIVLGAAAGTGRRADHVRRCCKEQHQTINSSSGGGGGSHRAAAPSAAAVAATERQQQRPQCQQRRQQQSGSSGAHSANSGSSSAHSANSGSGSTNSHHSRHPAHPQSIARFS